ncbi:Holliday junction branch migration protein RuvA [Candidatus Kaiserbacteria bacterium]|nr:MAG: Holliday junction branch migration protein RuvA [Candidatus Kaiserbacteria bacterium]
MFIQLTGKVALKDPEYMVLNVQGVGYKVLVSPDTLANSPENEDYTLWTHLAVREKSLDIYGFRNREDLEFFEMLIGVSGVGPKSAMAILSLADTSTLMSAIAQSDDSYLTKVSGIGAKSAKKIILDLGDKVGKSIHDPSLKEDMDAIEALATMGYSLAESRNALREVPRDITGAGERLKLALKTLSS